MSRKETQLENQAIYFYITKLKRRAFNTVKYSSVGKSIKEFEEEVKQKTLEDIKRYEDTELKEKNELLRLIYQAEEKLKHENRKKVQTKLLFDQVVLRGVSAMNMQALNLSNSSLRGKSIKIDVYKTDYIREIENNFHSLMLPKTEGKLKKGA